MPASNGKMDKRKTRIVREKQNQGGQRTAPVAVSHIDLERIKARYAGRTVDDEPFDEYDEEELPDGQAYRRVADSDRELNIFGEDDDTQERAPRERRGLVLVFLATLLITAIAGLYFLLIVDTIRVSGNETLEKGEVLTIAGLNPGDHLWLADVGDAKARLLAHPMIKEAVIKRVYPDTISIEITERSAAAAILSGGTAVIIDADGFVMEIASQVPEGMLEVYGVSSSGFAAGQDLSQDSGFSSGVLLEILAILSEQGILDIIDYIDMSQPLRIEMNTVYGIHVNVGQTDELREKLSNLPAVLSKVMEMGYEGGTIDLAVLGDPVYAPPSEETEPEETPVPETEGNDPAQDNPADDTTPQPSVEPTPGATPGSVTGGNTGKDGFSG